MQNEQDLVLKEFAKIEAMLNEQGKKLGIGSIEECIEKQKEKQRKLIEEGEEIVDYDLFEFANSKLISPTSYLKNGILAPRSFMLFAGPPKIGKSHFVLNLLINMAYGRPYLNTFVPTKPLNIYYLQTEVKEYTLWRRLQVNELIKSSIEEPPVGKIRITGATKKIRFDNEGIIKILKRIKKGCAGYTPDVICVDPLRNLFFSDGKGSDNTAEGMQEFCTRLETLRDIINPEASIILIHHTKKIEAKMLKEDPFNMIAGSGFLRGYYDTGIVFYRPDETMPNNVLMRMEVRDLLPGEHVTEEMHFLRKDWSFIPISTPAVEQVEHTPKPNKDLQLQHRLVELIQNEALEGRVYTMNSFAEEFENKEDLPSNKTIRRKLDKLAALQLLKFFNNPQAYGIAENPKELMYLCVPGMIVTVEEDIHLTIKVTHYKCPVKNILCAIE